MGCSGGHLRRALQDVTGCGVEASNCVHVDGRASYIASKCESSYDSSQAGEGKGEHFALGQLVSGYLSLLCHLRYAIQRGFVKIHFANCMIPHGIFHGSMSFTSTKQLTSGLGRSVGRFQRERELRMGATVIAYNQEYSTLSSLPRMRIE